MKEKVKEKIEFRYYETPQGFPLIALMGDKWVVPYGSDPMNFHNYLEIGVCRYGEGTMYLGNSKVPYFAINLLKRLHSRMFLVNGQEYPEYEMEVRHEKEADDYS